MSLAKTQKAAGKNNYEKLQSALKNFQKTIKEISSIKKCLLSTKKKASLT